MTRHLPSRFRKGAAAFAAIAVLAMGGRAWAQACCAGGSVVTPARLELHEDALVGAQLRAASVLGSYALDGSYVPSGAGASEYDFEEDLFGALRVARRGQVALLVPVVETRRQTSLDGAHFGGGIGDINASARYDFIQAGASRYVPGVALLAGVTFPTGTAPDSATQPLAVDSTGIGAFQFNAALALEQLFGGWLVNATAMVAKRTSHGDQTLAAQFTFLAAVAYTFQNDAALALSASYAFEGDASASDGSDVPDSARRVTVVALSGLWPLSDRWRLLGGLSFDPPVSGLGSNQPAQGGLTMTGIWSWM